MVRRYYYEAEQYFRNHIAALCAETKQISGDRRFTQLGGERAINDANASGIISAHHRDVLRVRNYAYPISYDNSYKKLPLRTHKDTW